jgi:DNA-binding NarL/FixJ family response regulator
MCGVDSHQPDVVLIAFDGSTERELAVLAELPSVAARARTVLLTSEMDGALHAHMIELGVMGLVPKGQSAQVLVKAVKKVHAGELWLDRSRTADVVPARSGLLPTDARDHAPFPHRANGKQCARENSELRVLKACEKIAVVQAFRPAVSGGPKVRTTRGNDFFPASQF